MGKNLVGFKDPFGFFYKVLESKNSGDALLLKLRGRKSTILYVLFDIETQSTFSGKGWEPVYE